MKAKTMKPIQNDNDRAASEKIVVGLREKIHQVLADKGDCKTALGLYKEVDVIEARIKRYDDNKRQLSQTERV